MGTTYHVRVVQAELPPQHVAGLRDSVAKALQRVNDLMSTYDPSSELSRFNACESTKAFPVSDDTAAVIRVALETSKQSEGAFDVTVGPLVELWGFGSKGRRTEPPPAAAIAKCLPSVGSHHLHLLPGPALRKDVPELHVDLSAVAKGFGVDKTAEALESRGITRYLVEVGGECRARGANERGEVWRVGIDRPVAGNLPGADLEKVLALKDASLATSGDYRNFFEWKGKRYSHTLDPHTGWPVPNALASVSVVAKTCVVADGMATALMALGPDRGLALAEDRPGVDALLITRTKDGAFRETMTSAMRRYLRPPVR